MENDGKLNSLLEKLKDCNVERFKKNFIIAGPKVNVLAIYRALINARVSDQDIQRSKNYSAYKNIVVLCINNTKNGILNFPEVCILTRGWWDLYHNKKKNHTTEVYKTYNVPRQQKQVFENIVLTPIEILEAE